MEKPMVPYLLLVSIRTPAPEHGRVLTALRTISPDPKPAYFEKHGFGILFNCDRPLRDIHLRVYESVMSDDEYLIVELGPRWGAYGLEPAKAWLTHHLGKAQFQKAQKRR